MSNWKYEIMRSAAQSCYWLNYRYAEGRKLTALDYVNDVMANEEVLDSPFDADVVETSIWHERWYSGHHEKKTGRYIFTVPRPERLSAASKFVENSDLVTPVALFDHTGVNEEAEQMARKNGFDRYADQAYFAGRLRGNFVMSALEQNRAEHSVLIFHRLQHEVYFRVREIRVIFERHQKEQADEFASRMNSMAWDDYQINDGWAATGTNIGSVFLLRCNGGPEHEFSTSDYRWDTKNNRILGLKAGEANRYELCQKPVQIEQSLKVLRSVSEAASHINAA